MADLLEKQSMEDTFFENALENVAVVGGIATAAFSLYKSDFGKQLIGHIDPLFGRISERLSYMNRHGDNPFTFEELGVGFKMAKSNYIGEGFDPLTRSASLDNKEAMNLIHEIAQNHDYYSFSRNAGQAMYYNYFEESMLNQMDSMGFGLSEKGREALSVTFKDNAHTFIDFDKGLLKTEGEAALLNLANGNLPRYLSEADSKALRGYIDSTINQDIPVAFNPFANFVSQDEIQNTLMSMHKDYKEQWKSQIDVLITKAEEETRTSNYHYITLGEYENFGRGHESDDNQIRINIKRNGGEQNLTLNEIATDSIFDAYNLKNLPISKSRFVKDNATPGANNPEDIIDHSFTKRMLDGVKSFAKSTLPYKLAGIEGFQSSSPRGIESITKEAFQPYIQKILGKTDYVRVGQSLYQKDGTTGGYKKVELEGGSWYKGNATNIESQSIAMGYADPKSAEQTNWKSRGESPHRRHTTLHGNNIDILKNADLSKMTNEDLSYRIFSLKNHLDIVDHDIDTQTFRKMVNGVLDQFGHQLSPEHNHYLTGLVNLLSTGSPEELRTGLNGISSILPKNSSSIIKPTKEFNNLLERTKKGEYLGTKIVEDAIGVTEKGNERIEGPVEKTQSLIKEEIINSILQGNISLGPQYSGRVTDPDSFRALLHHLTFNINDGFNIGRGDAEKISRLASTVFIKNFDQLPEIISEGSALKLAGGPRALAEKVQKLLNGSPTLNESLAYSMGTGVDRKVLFESTKVKQDYVYQKNTTPFQKLADLSPDKIADYVLGGGLFDTAKSIFAGSTLDLSKSAKYLKHVNLEEIAPDFKTGNSLSEMNSVGAYAYRIANRINDQLNETSLSTFFGVINENFSDWASKYINLRIPLGLHRADATTTLGITKNLMLKRLLPASILLSQAEWADDTFDINENFQTGLANMDLGFRRIVDGLGMTNFMKRQKMLNPIAEYISGDYTLFQSYNERLDYYQNGYDPIRSGRYWVWGSTNEFRGSSVSYWEPNSLRLVTSDYKMKSIYGSYWNKYLHSPIPTLTNPLSPLFYLANPYWVEEQHSEDRPYLKSGPLFEKNSLQGALFNWNIGELIKPERSYHDDRMWFGRDVYAVMYNMHQQEMEKRDDNRYIIFQNGRLGIYDFNSFQNPNMQESINSGDAEEYREQASPVFTSAADYSNALSSDGSLDTDEYQSLASGSTSGAGGFGIRSAITSMNKSVAGEYIQQRIRKNSSTKTVHELLENAGYYNDIMNSNADSIVNQSINAVRAVSGIYGYAGVKFFGENEKTRIADAGDITSFARSFWDMGFGGLGSEGAEIARRFIPEFSRRHRINPLMNELAEKHPWLPEKFFRGDPYASMPMGEARLPGTGYEALNQLHPDQFGQYGVIDRYKILADIAPNSEEYKYYKTLIKMLEDPEAKKIYNDAEERIKHQNKRYDFFNYKFLGKTTKGEEVGIESIQSNGKFTIVGDDKLYQIAGVKFNTQGEESKKILQEILNEGSKVMMYTDDIEISKDNKVNAPIKAALFLDGQNISEMLIDHGLAQYDREDSSAAGAKANYNPLSRALGTGLEFLTHLNIPIIHSQFLRINSSLESYEQNQIYGSGFESWDHPIDSMIMPSVYQGKTGLFLDFLGESAYRYHNAIEDGFISASKTGRRFAKHAYRYLDRPTLIGHIFSRFAYSGENREHYANATTALTRYAGNAFSLYTSLQDPLYAAFAWGRFGYDTSAFFNPFEKLIVSTNEDWENKIFSYQKLSDQFFRDYDETLRTSIAFTEARPIVNTLTDDLYRGAYELSSDINTPGLIKDTLDTLLHTRPSRIVTGLASAGIGVALSIANYNSVTETFGQDSMFIPDHVKERWDVEEYFDRLRYIKYMSLYAQAAKIAINEEDTDVAALYRHQDYVREHESDDISLSNMIASVLVSGSPLEDGISQFKRFMFGTMNEDMTVLSADKFTELAIMYKQAAENTIYGLTEDSEYSDIIRALPDYEKEFFEDFSGVLDEEERDKILREVSPSLKKALKLVWYGELEDQMSNELYFSTHNLPSVFWEGWQADKDMSDIRAKVIYNEGLSYADYGIFASKYEEPNVQDAPNIDDIKDSDDPITVKAKLGILMKGYNLSSDDVDVYKTSDPSTLSVIQDTVSVLGYKIETALSKVF